jgi:SagB-type dehydrogenase family enzyme
MNPSSGNLHPTECYLMLPPLDGEEGGVFHYDPYFHALERRTRIGRGLWQRLAVDFPAEGFFAALSSVVWREAWKYGEQAFRYSCQDIGHALACLGFSAGLQGWKTTYMKALSDKDLETLLGFDRARWGQDEREIPQCMLYVQRGTDAPVPGDIPVEVIESFKGLAFSGEPNVLSAQHVDWPMLDEMATLTEKPRTEKREYACRSDEYLEREIPSIKAAEIIRRRRSALAFDPGTTVPKEHFLAILDKTVPRSGCAPFDMETGEVLVHLLLFVHRVNGIEPGLYFLLRNEGHFGELKEKCHAGFLWKEVRGVRGLYLLKSGEYRQDATFVSCMQEIAGNGAFAVAMVGRFREPIQREPHSYRTLHWEAGMVGQVLYLEAEAHGLRGTGMGCFFDDPVHDLLGLRDNAYQDIYHFTMGGAIEDTRLATRPPYSHLKR